MNQTFMGINEEEIKDFRLDIERYEDFKTMTNDEKMNLKSLNDLLSELQEGVE